MFLVLKIGSRFFTFISSSKPTLHSLVCSLPVCRSPLERGFLIICSQTDLLLCVILSCPPSSWMKFFFLNLSPLRTWHSLHVILPPFSALVLLLLLVHNFLLCHSFILSVWNLSLLNSLRQNFFHQQLLVPNLHECVHVQCAVCAPGWFCSLPVLPKSLLEVSFNF